MLDLIDQVPESAPQFSIEDLSRGVLTDLLGGADSPFESKDGFRDVRSITPAFTILHYLRSFDLLQQYCNIDAIADHFAALQHEKKGYFRSALGQESGFYDDCDDAVQLQILVGINLLESTFDKRYMGRIKQMALRAHLTVRLRQLTGKILPLCDQWLYDLGNVIASLHLVDRQLKNITPSEATRIANAIMRCFGLERCWSRFVRSHQGKDLDDIITAWTVTTSDSFRKTPSVEHFPGHISQSLGGALWSAYKTLTLLRRSSAIALLERAATSGEQKSYLHNNPYYVLGTAFLLRKTPLVSLRYTHQFWFRREQSLSVPVTNDSARPLHLMRLSFGAQQEASNGVLGAATNDPQFMRIVPLRVQGELLDPASLAAGELRKIKVTLKTIERVNDYPLLFLNPRIECRYARRDVHLHRDYFRPQMTVQMLPDRHKIRQLMEQIRRRATTHSDLIRLLGEELRNNYDVAFSSAESERLYREFVPNPTEQWLQQFEPNDRRLMRKLVDHFVFYSADDMRELFRRAFLSPEFRKKAEQAIFVGVGKHQGKSGPHLLLYVKHAYKSVFPHQKAAEIELRFTNPSNLPFSLWKDAEARAPQIGCIVFVDDFFGSGKTACEFLDKFRRSKGEVFRWLWRKDKFFLALSGFKQGKERIVENFPELEERVILADRLLSNADRAFSPGNRIFDSADQRNRAEHVCRLIGEEILRERARREKLTDDRRKEIALGWDNDQALIGFQHNTPNNTLPIIWEYLGQYDGKPWMPLYQRHD